MDMTEAFDKTIRRWKNARASLTATRCFLCTQVAGDCAICPIGHRRDPNKSNGCVKEFGRVIAAIDDLLVALEEDKTRGH